MEKLNSKELSMFCITLNPSHLNIIKKLNYLPVGLGKKEFTSEWFKDASGDNITHKNPFYGEYTFHYWLWKNNILDKEYSDFAATAFNPFPTIETGFSPAPERNFFLSIGYTF